MSGIHKLSKIRRKLVLVCLIITTLLTLQCRIISPTNQNSFRPSAPVDNQTDPTSPDSTWILAIGGDGRDYAPSFCETNDGFLVAGMSSSYGLGDGGGNQGGLSRARVRHRPRLLSDNGPAHLSKALAQYIKRKNMDHVRGDPYHPMTQGKIERWHRTMKNVVKLENYYSPSELKAAIGKFVDYYNNELYHESIGNVTPSDMYFGRAKEVKTRREKIKHRTLRERKRLHKLQFERV